MYDGIKELIYSGQAVIVEGQADYALLASYLRGHRDWLLGPAGMPAPLPPGGASPMTGGTAAGALHQRAFGVSAATVKSKKAPSGVTLLRAAIRPAARALQAFSGSAVREGAMYNRNGMLRRRYCMRVNLDPSAKAHNCLDRIANCANRGSWIGSRHFC